MQSSFGESSALFRSGVPKTLDLGSNSRKILSVGTKKTKKLRKASGSKGAKKPYEHTLSSNDDIDVDSIQVDVL